MRDLAWCIANPAKCSPEELESARKAFRNGRKVIHHVDVDGEYDVTQWQRTGAKVERREASERRQSKITTIDWLIKNPKMENHRIRRIQIPQGSWIDVDRRKPIFMEQPPLYLVEPTASIAIDPASPDGDMSCYAEYEDGKLVKVTRVSDTWYQRIKRKWRTTFKRR